MISIPDDGSGIGYDSKYRSKCGIGDEIINDDLSQEILQGEQETVSEGKNQGAY